MTSRGSLLSNNKQSNQSVYFTLPITCQICLGKVKEPCVCPNLHAFCSFCLEIWLEKSKHCPTCRVPIDKENPCRRILGGIENVDESDLMKPTEFSHPSTRKARYFSIFQQYEDEIMRLSNFVESLNEENKKLKESGKTLNQASMHSSPQHDMIQLLKHKLQTVQNNYDTLMRERDELKEQNKKLESENSILLQDNARLKTVLNEKNSQTSKYTVAALESKIEGYEKEIKQLQKALDKSDKYIADLEFKRDLKDKENKLSRHLSEETFTSNSMSVIPSPSSAFSVSRPSNTSINISSSIKSTKNEAINKTDLKSVKFSEKVDKYPSSGLSSPSRSSEQPSIKKNVISKDNFYGSPRKSTGHSNNSTSAFISSSFGDRLKKLNTTNTTVTSNYDFEAPTHLSQSLLNMNNNQSSNLLLSNSSNSFTNQPISQSFLFSPMKRLRLEEVNLEKPEPDPVEKTKNITHDNINTSSEFIDCMEILNRAEKNVQNRQISPRKGYASTSSHFTANEKAYSQLGDVLIQSDSSVNSSSSSGNSLSANGASSLSSFSNTTSSESSSCNLNSLIKKSSKKKSDKNQKMSSLLVNSYSLNSHQNQVPQQDIVYKDYGQSLNYATNPALNMSVVNRSRSVETSLRNFK